VVVHVDREVLEHDGIGQCALEDDPSLAPGTARRLACDAGVVPITEDGDDEPLNVGRKTRSIPPAIRRALNPSGDKSLRRRAVNRHRGLDISPSTCVPRWAGERMDYGLAIDGLLVSPATGMGPP
jgi:hypothetical protein